MIKTRLEIRREAELIIKTNVLDKKNIDINQHEELELAYLNTIDYLADFMIKIQNIKL